MAETIVDRRIDARNAARIAKEKRRRIVGWVGPRPSYPHAAVLCCLGAFLGRPTAANLTELHWFPSWNRSRSLDFVRQWTRLVRDVCDRDAELDRAGRQITGQIAAMMKDRKRFKDWPVEWVGRVLADIEKFGEGGTLNFFSQSCSGHDASGP